MVGIVTPLLSVTKAEMTIAPGHRKVHCTLATPSASVVGEGGEHVVPGGTDSLTGRPATEPVALSASKPMAIGRGTPASTVCVLGKGEGGKGG